MDRNFAILVAATILAARKLAELERQGINILSPAGESAIANAVSTAERIMRRIENH